MTRTKTPDILIEAKDNTPIFNWKELRQYKDLLFFLVWRDIKTLYAQSILGIGWAFIRPFFSMVVFSIIFGGLAKVSSDGVPYPIFSYTALLPWVYFSTAMTSSAGSLAGNVAVFSKVYFPRILMPLTPVIAGLLDFAIASCFLGGLMVWYGIYPNINIVWLPLLVLLMIISSFGIGLGLSSLAIQYRDVRFGLQFFTQILMYAAPVVWPTSLIVEKWPEHAQIIRIVYGLYPIAGVIEGMRAALLGTIEMPWDLIASGTVSSLLILWVGSAYFHARERIFADVA